MQGTCRGEGYESPAPQLLRTPAGAQPLPKPRRDWSLT